MFDFIYYIILSQVYITYKWKTKTINATVGHSTQSGLPGNNRSVLSWPTDTDSVPSLLGLLRAPVAAVVELWTCWISGRALSEGEGGACSEAPKETHQVRQGQVQTEVHLGEEVEIHQRPETSPVVKGGQERHESHGVEEEVTTAPPRLPVLSDSALQKEDQPREKEGQEDTVPSLDVLHHDLAVVEDEVVL